MKLVRGRYLALITRQLSQALADLEPGLLARTELVDPAELPDRIALHLSRVIERGLSGLAEGARAEAALRLAAEIVRKVATETGVPLQGEEPVEPAAQLAGVLRLMPTAQTELLPAPLVPLLDTALMTNAPGEPRIGQQIASEIPSADRIDLVMAFIRWTGISPLLPVLRQHCERGGALRVLTTTYTGSTELRALQQLADLGADVRISYEVGSTRLHAKAWYFHRASGYSTAFVGSSNLTHSAQVTGLEWNVRFSAVRNPLVVERVAAVFESYWNGSDFVPFEPEQFRRALRQLGDAHSATTFLSPVELRLEPFQERLLELIALSRRSGYHRNLLAAATGTGKTVMAAVDYARLRERLPRARLLFVAHRKEILAQALATFRHALRDPSFGELWVDGSKPADFVHVFSSVQSLSRANLGLLDAAHFDVVVIDEFHHSEAITYRRLLEHVRPLELLGLTATPERTDGQSILHWFGNRIAAELRLWDAIDQHRLVPFTYFGLADDTDFTRLPWQRGRGYEVEAVSNLLTANDVWARRVLRALLDKTADVKSIRALGFCVNVTHARFMADVFSRCGVPSVAVDAETPAAERERALKDLVERRLNVVFSVDLFNEGVDVPTVDTLLMLRPTDSATLFLQQLGRGLRRHHGKTQCVVIDFVGQHRKEFRFDRRLQALLGGTRTKLREQVERGFPFLPAGCHMEFDRVATQRVLDNLRNSLPTTRSQRVQELRALAADGTPVSLAGYLVATGLELDDVYHDGQCWTDLLEAAGLLDGQPGAEERQLRRMLGRLLHIDDHERLERYRQWLAVESAPVSSLPERDERLLRMLVVDSMDRRSPDDWSIERAAARLWSFPRVRGELYELMGLLAHRVSHLGQSLQQHPDLPLWVHARYTRKEIQAAFGDGDERKASLPAWREGVRWMERERADVFLVTLDKTAGGFSPTTRYRDYAISRHLFHWESQSRTREGSAIGQRYIHHVNMGSNVMLFARLSSSDRAFHFLGSASYVSHRSEMPMQITWRLEHPLPGDLFASFAAAVA